MKFGEEIDHKYLYICCMKILFVYQKWQTWRRCETLSFTEVATSESALK
jgi:hypothetical protein